MTTSPRPPRTAALATPLLGTALVLIVALVVFLIAQRPTAEIAAREPAATAIAATAPTLSPAEALAFDRPIVLFIYPVESCEQRYCLQPTMIADRLGAEFGDAVSFVPIRSQTTADVPTASAAVALEGWDLYLLPPYDAWLPDLQIDAGGYGLSAPTLVLIDRDRQVVARSTSSAEIVASLHALVGDEHAR